MAVSEFDKLINKIKDSTPNMISGAENGTIKWAHVPSPQVSYMFGGGIPTGRIIRFRGPSSSGKSAFCNYIAGCLQKECPKLYDNPNKNKVVYIDFERTFEMRFAETVGVDVSPDKFFLMRAQSIEDCADALLPLVNTGEIAAIIFDSDASAPTKAMWVDESGKANFGAGAKAIAEFLRKFNIACADTGTTLLWISQERAAMGFGQHLPSVTGGTALPFYSSIICRITKTDDIKGDDGDIAGIVMRVRNYKNKCSIPFRDAEGLKLYYNGGFNSADEYIDFYLRLNIITQKGAYFQFERNGEKFSLQGRKKLDEYLKANPDAEAEWKEKVDYKLSHYSEELDAKNIALDEEGNVVNEKDAEAYSKYIADTTSKTTNSLNDSIEKPVS